MNCKLLFVVLLGLGAAARAQAPALQVAPLPLEVSAGKDRALGSRARIVLSQEPRSVLGRIRFVPEKGEPVELLLHGQSREAKKLPAGHYAVQAFFWRPDQVKETPYPSGQELEIGEGQTARLTLDRDFYSDVKKFLREEDSRASAPPVPQMQKGVTQ